MNFKIKLFTINQGKLLNIILILIGLSELGEGGEGGIAAPSQILAGKLTLFQPGWQIIPTTLLVAPFPGFSDLPTDLIIIV